MEEVKIEWSELENIEYETKLGKSLKNTLHKFDKEELYDELFSMIKHYTTMAESIPYEKRIKAIHSCELKYLKYYPNTPVEKVFNDILGIRITVSSYDVFDSIDITENAKIADMRNGKATDDGYRGIHVYLQKSHFHYPIEIQFVTPEDKFFNELLHDNTYKYVKDATIGKTLRKLYDDGVIKSSDDFRKELEYVLSSG